MEGSVVFHPFKHCRGIFYPTGGCYKDLNSLTSSMSVLIMELYNRTDMLQFIVRGASGSIMAGSICEKLTNMGFANLSVIVSRKKHEISHSKRSLQGINTDINTKTIILDDFVESSDTIRDIIDDLDNELGYEKYDLLLLGETLDRLNILKDKFNKFKVVAHMNENSFQNGDIIFNNNVEDYKLAMYDNNNRTHIVFDLLSSSFKENVQIDHGWVIASERQALSLMSLLESNSYFWDSRRKRLINLNEINNKVKVC